MCVVVAVPPPPSLPAPLPRDLLREGAPQGIRGLPLLCEGTPIGVRGGDSGSISSGRECGTSGMLAGWVGVVTLSSDAAAETSESPSMYIVRLLVDDSAVGEGVRGSGMSSSRNRLADCSVIALAPPLV